ncbi:hypothetical protein J4477_03665 [Candidatus Pacearchaeota archaeon]|nr:hypothetical protein [Candidatus Pacearchaeota archaeon]
MYNSLSESDRFKEFYGQSRVQMPLILAGGRVPLSVAGIMRRKIEVHSPEFKAIVKDLNN